MQDAKGALTRLYTALRGAGGPPTPPDWHSPHGRRFLEAMDDDFGTPGAVAVLFELANDANRGVAGAAAQLRALGGVLGILQRDPEEFLQAGAAGGIAEDRVVELIEARNAARKARNFAEADRIRKELLAAGVVLEDGPSGSTWRRV
jgi:cysteinyl-tRNA synthetase